MKDARFWIILKDSGPNKGSVARCLREHSGLALSEAIRIARNPPQLVPIDSGYMSYEDAKRRAMPILRELEALGAEADWDFDYGDIE